MLAMEAMVLGPQALLSAAMNPVLSADFSPVPAALQRRKPELQGLKTAVAVLHSLAFRDFVAQNAARRSRQVGRSRCPAAAPPAQTR